MLSIVCAIVNTSILLYLSRQDYLSKVKYPTLFIVGRNDSKKVIDLNNDALKQLGPKKKNW